MTVAQRLGFAEDAKLVIPHADDVGMCHGANLAFAELAGAGFITCGSIMPPCPWMLEAVELAKERPELDLGVHLTLTSEWRHYRWRPLIGSTRSSGLVDDEGYFWRTARETIEHADLGAVEEELRAQIEAVTARGATPTHLDCHMGTALAPRFADIYSGLQRSYALPVLMPRRWTGYGCGLGIDGASEQEHAARVASVERAGSPVVDRFIETPWAASSASEQAYRDLIDSIGPGLTFLAFHPNKSGDIEAIDPPRSHCRTDEVRIFKSGWFLDHVRAAGIVLLGFRDLVERVRAAA